MFVLVFVDHKTCFFFDYIFPIVCAVLMEKSEESKAESSAYQDEQEVSAFICPCTLKIMENPVITADGNSK